MLLYKICHQFLDRYKSKSLVGKKTQDGKELLVSFSSVHCYPIIHLEVGYTFPRYNIS